MPLAVTLRELKNSYVRLREAADTNPAPVSHLLRFYSVECGLKAMVLKDRNAQSTEQQGDLITHDLRRLAQTLRLSASEYRNLVDCRRLSRGGHSHDQVAAHQLHEAWRYGTALDPGDEKRSVAGLSTLGQICRERIGR